MRSIFFKFIFSFLAGLALAIPPACLIHGVNTQEDPADLSSVCGNGAKTVQKYLASNCGQQQDTAQKAFIATCSSAGTSVGESRDATHLAKTNIHKLHTLLQLVVSLQALDQALLLEQVLPHNQQPEPTCIIETVLELLVLQHLH